MRKKVTEEQNCCDFCGKADCYEKCLGCGKDVCHDCQKKQGIEYRHGVYFSGSGDGFYCFPCDSVARQTKDPMHAAYLLIQRLRDELNGWSKDFRERQQAAEKALEKLQGR